MTSIGRGRSPTCAAMIRLHRRLLPHAPPQSWCVFGRHPIAPRINKGGPRGCAHRCWDSWTKRSRCARSPILHSQLLACNNPIAKAPYLRITLGSFGTSRDCTSSTKVCILHYSTNKTEMRKIYGLFRSVVPLYQSHCVHLWQLLRVESTNNHQMVSPRVRKTLL